MQSLSVEPCLASISISPALRESTYSSVFFRTTLPATSALGQAGGGSNFVEPPPAWPNVRARDLRLLPSAHFSLPPISHLALKTLRISRTTTSDTLPKSVISLNSVEVCHGVCNGAHERAMAWTSTVIKSKSGVKRSICQSSGDERGGNRFRQKRKWS